ncbi:Cullin family-domain-containing protein [Mycena epipterygia]|nr:Cullin family-domain-containing protein [Mycena epipterygia]
MAPPRKENGTCHRATFILPYTLSERASYAIQAEVTPGLRAWKVVGPFVSLGLDAADPNKECLDYATEASAFLNAGIGNIVEYLKNVEAHLHEEQRVVRYLHAKTRKALVGRCTSVLLWDLFQTLLDHDADEDLQPFTRCLRTSPRSLNRYCARSSGGGAEDAKAKAGSDEAKGGEINPTAYAAALLAVREKNAATVARSFRVIRALRPRSTSPVFDGGVLRYFAGMSATRASELLAKHTELLLRKSNKVAGEGALNRVIPTTIQVPRGQRRVPDVLHHEALEAAHPRRERVGRSEAIVISKLKEERGSEYTHEQAAAHALRHVPLKGLTDPFKERTAQDPDDRCIEFGIMVLGRARPRRTTARAAPHREALHAVLQDQGAPPHGPQADKYILVTSVLLQYTRNVAGLQEAAKLGLRVKAGVLVN